MGLFSKIAFWKGSDDLADFGDSMGGDPFGGDQGLGSTDNLGMPSSTPGGAEISGSTFPDMSPPSAAQNNLAPPSGMPISQPANMGAHGVAFAPPEPAPHDYTLAKDIEIISSKLDALRSAIESINQRLVSIERLARGDEDKRDRLW
ncbi:MAG: hypothetical protein ABH879_07115 [archaeon]